MDIEKLTEARSKFIRDNRALIGNNAPLIADAFDACAEAIMKMPLSERLTEEEKEKLTPANRYILGTIFGSDLFK